jgi:hypothetical protein
MKIGIVVMGYANNNTGRVAVFRRSGESPDFRPRHRPVGVVFYRPFCETA